MKPGDCKHFRGIQHATCLAGVRMADVRDSSGPGPYRWPCLVSVRTSKTEPCRTTCAKFEALTAEEACDQLEALIRASDAVARQECPVCGGKLTVREIAGRARVSICPTHGEVARGCRISEEP